MGNRNKTGVREVILQNYGNFKGSFKTIWGKTVEAVSRFLVFSFSFVANANEIPGLSW